MTIRGPFCILKQTQQNLGDQPIRNGNQEKALELSKEGLFRP